MLGWTEKKWVRWAERERKQLLDSEQPVAFFIAPQMAVPEGHTQGLEAPHCIVWVKNRLRKIAINGPLYSRGVGVKGAVDPFFILV